MLALYNYTILYLFAYLCNTACFFSVFQFTMVLIKDSFSTQPRASPTDVSSWSRDQEEAALSVNSLHFLYMSSIFYGRFLYKASPDFSLLSRS